MAATVSACLRAPVQSPATAEHALAVLPQHLRATIRVRDVQRLLHHLSDSGVGLRLDVGGSSSSCATRAASLQPGEIVLHRPRKCQPSVGLAGYGRRGSSFFLAAIWSDLPALLATAAHAGQ